MDDRFERLESEVRHLRERVLALERRLAGPPIGAPADTDEASDLSAVSPPPIAMPGDSVAILSLVGRTFIVFGGAYLLRALSESGRLPLAAGVALGFAYALGWLVAADRAARRSRSLDAAMHGVASALIGYPLVVEATYRFRLLPPAVSAAALAILTGAALLVAWRRGHRWLAWLACLASIGASLFLINTTGELLPYGAFMVVLGVATLWLAYDRDWFALRWPPALVADLCVLGVTVRALGTMPREAPMSALALQVGLLTGYLASISGRTLVRGRNVVPFEIVQSVLALGAGLGGAVAVTRAAPSVAGLLATACLVLAAGCYAVAFAFVDRRQGRGMNFYFYTSLAVVYALVGTRLSMGDVPLAVTWSILGVAAAWIGSRASRAALFLHSAVYIAGAGTVSGLFQVTASSFAGPLPAPLTGGGSATAWGVIVAAALAALAPRLRLEEGSGDPALLPRLALILTFVAGTGGAIVRWGSALVSAGGGGVPADGTVSTIRSIVLGAAAVIAGLLGRSERLAEARRLVHPVLAAGALKLLLEDLRLSSASGLFVALAVYGTALILAPRLIRSKGPAASGDAGQAARGSPS